MKISVANWIKNNSTLYIRLRCLWDVEYTGCITYRKLIDAQGSIFGELEVGSMYLFTVITSSSTLAQNGSTC